MFRLAAFQENAATDDATKTSEAPPADAKAGETATSPPPETPATTAPAPPAVPAAAAAPATPATPEPPKKPLEFDALEKVKDQIRRRIAEEKVSEELNKLANDIYAELDGVFTKYQTEALTADADKQPAPPVPAALTNLAPLAEKHGLTSSSTGPKSYLEMRDTPVGKSAVLDANRRLIDMLYFSKEPDLYQPLSAVDIDGNHFIVLKKSDTPARVPTLAEVKGDVIKAWKAEKAAELAEKRAQEVAKKAQEAKQPLTEFFADDPKVKVIRTDPFSELTGGDVGLVNGQLQRQPYRLGQPSDIIAPGPAFLNEVFKLKDGEVGTAFNNDHSIAYVIRVVEHQPPVNELRSAYLAEANNWPGLASMVQGHAQEVASALAADVTTSANLKWERKKDQEQLQEEQARRQAQDTESGG